jgi:hypothetical protein
MEDAADVAVSTPRRPSLNKGYGPAMAEGANNTRRRRWSAAKVIAWIILRVETNVLTPEMGPKLAWAGCALAEAIGVGDVHAWGRRTRDGLHEKMPSSQFRISGLPLRVSPHGELTTLRPDRLWTYQGIRWQDIEVDPVKLKEAFPAPDEPVPEVNEAPRYIERYSDWIKRAFPEPAPATNKSAPAAADGHLPAAGGSGPVGVEESKQDQSAAVPKLPKPKRRKRRKRKPEPQRKTTQPARALAREALNALYPKGKVPRAEPNDLLKDKVNGWLWDKYKRRVSRDSILRECGRLKVRGKKATRASP